MRGQSPHYPMFDDEFPTENQRGRRMENDTGYQEYCDLWKRFEELCVSVRWRNRPIEDGVDANGVKRIIVPPIFLQLQNEDLSQEARNELIKFQAQNIELWSQMDTIVNALLKNKYVLSRIISRQKNKYLPAEYQYYMDGNGNPKEVECYRNALYQCIYP